jgi:hypothetical protein
MKVRIGTILVLIVLALFSCSRKTVPVLTATRDTANTTIREKVVRVEVPVPADSSVIQALLACDSIGNVYMRTIEQLQGERIKQDVKLENNKVTIKASDNAKEVHETSTSDSIKYVYREKAVPYPVEVNKLTSWQSFQIWTGRIVLILLLLFGIYRMALKAG